MAPIARKRHGDHKCDDAGSGVDFLRALDAASSNGLIDGVMVDDSTSANET